MPCKIDDTSTTQRVRFTPTEIGPHSLNVKFGSEQMPGKIKLRIDIELFSSKGAPIKLMVNDTRFVTAYGDGLHHSLQDRVANFMIDTKEMEGDLKVRIEGRIFKIANKIFSLLCFN